MDLAIQLLSIEFSEQDQREGVDDGFRCFHKQITDADPQNVSSKSGGVIQAGKLEILGDYRWRNCSGFQLPVRAMNNRIQVRRGHTQGRTTFSVRGTIFRASSDASNASCVDDLASSSASRSALSRD